jgi:glutamate racemase
MAATIGVFDSGIGGLGIFAEVRRLLPEADLIYVADHSHSPYGERTLADLRRRCDEVTEWLIGQECTVITLACNTASAAALHPLRRRHPDIAFVGMEPAVKPAVASTGTGKVGVVATSATFQGELFASVVDRFAAGVEVVTAACPRWVELVEEGTVSDRQAHEQVELCLTPMIEAGVDVLVLACTHYPALTETIRDVMGPDVTIIDPAPAVARQTGRMAAKRGDDMGGMTTALFSTGDVGRLETAARRLGIPGTAALLRLP